MRILGLLIGTLISAAALAGEGHRAGYDWASQRGIDDPDSCYSRSGGAINNSPSFTEGCLEYLRDENITNDDDELVDEDDEDEDENW